MAEWKKVIVSGSNISELNNDANYVASTGGGIVSGSGQITMGGDTSGTADNVTVTKIQGVAITSGEATQIANIGTSAISATEWGYLANMNQGVSSTDSVTFNDVTISTGTITVDVVGTADTASYVSSANVKGAVASAIKLENQRTFAVTGDASSTPVNFDGTGNVSMAISLAANSVDSSELVNGSIDEVHFSAGAEAAISGAFTAVSGGLADRITTLEASDFVYDLNIQGDSGNGTIADSDTLDIAGGTDITTAFSGTTLTVNLDATISSDTTGNAATATALENARTIGGVSFDGTQNINLPGVNTAGNQNTSGNAATATALANARTIGGTSFDGTANITPDNANTASYVAGGNVVGAVALATSATSATTATSAGSLSSGQNFSIAGDVTAGTVSFNGTGPVQLNASVTQVQGVAISATEAGYVANMDQEVSSGASPQFASLTLSGDLTVNGTTTTISTTNMEVEDQFISLNDGGAAADGGIVIEGQGTAFGWDESANRWAFDFAGATSTQTAIAADAYAAAVVTTDDANYRKNGNIRITAGDIFIYTE
jgi:hypothetical protein